MPIKVEIRRGTMTIIGFGDKREKKS